VRIAVEGLVYMQDSVMAEQPTMSRH